MDSSRDWDRRYDRPWLVCLGYYETLAALAMFRDEGFYYSEVSCFVFSSITFLRFSLIIQGSLT